MIQNLPYLNIDISCASNINITNIYRIFLINIIHVVVSHMRYQQFYAKKNNKKNPRSTDLDGHLSIIARRWTPQGVSYLDFNLHFGV